MKEELKQLLEEYGIDLYDPHSQKDMHVALKSTDVEELVTKMWNLAIDECVVDHDSILKLKI